MVTSDKGQLLIRGIDRAALEALRERARRNHRSMSAEVRAMIERSAEAEIPGNDADAQLRRERAIVEAERMRRALAGRMTSNSVDLIREDRDR